MDFLDLTGLYVLALRRPGSDLAEEELVCRVGELLDGDSERTHGDWEVARFTPAFLLDVVAERAAPFACEAIWPLGQFALARIAFDLLEFARLLVPSLRGCPQGVAIVDHQGRFARADRRAARLHGRGPAELVGAFAGDLYLSDEWRSVSAAMERLAPTGRIDDLRLTVDWPQDAARAALRVSGLGLRGVHGEMRGYLCVYTAAGPARPMGATRRGASRGRRAHRKRAAGSTSRRVGEERGV